MATRAGVDRHVIVGVAAACVRVALPFAPTDDARIKRAIDVADLWTRHLVDSRACREAGYAASTVAIAEPDERACDAATAAAFLAFACEDTSDDAYAAARPYAAEAVLLACATYRQNGRTAERLAASRVRARIPYGVLIEAVERSQALGILSVETTVPYLLRRFASTTVVRASSVRPPGELTQVVVQDAQGERALSTEAIVELRRTKS